MRRKRQAGSTSSKKVSSTQSAIAPENSPGKPRELNAAPPIKPVILGPFSGHDGGRMAARLELSGELYVEIGMLAAKYQMPTAEMFQRIVLVGLQWREIMDALQNADNTLNELRLFADTLRAAIRAWDEEGQPTPAALDKREFGVQLLSRRLIDALQSHLNTIHAAMRGNV